MKAAETLHVAADIIGGDRAQTHGDLAKNMKMISGLWSTYLGYPVCPRDTAIMMALLKAARLKTGSASDDHFIDMAGYAAIAGEVK